MKYFIIFLLSFIVSFLLASVSTYISLIMQKRKAARSSYQFILLTYEHLMLIRSLYYKSKFIENDKKRQEMQANYIKLYKDDLEVLDNPKYTLYKDYLSPEEKEKLEETLALPRYELI